MNSVGISRKTRGIGQRFPSSVVKFAKWIRYTHSGVSIFRYFGDNIITIIPTAYNDRKASNECICFEIECYSNIHAEIRVNKHLLAASMITSACLGRES